MTFQEIILTKLVESIDNHLKILIRKEIKKEVEPILASLQREISELKNGNVPKICKMNNTSGPVWSND